MSANKFEPDKKRALGKAMAIEANNQIEKAIKLLVDKWPTGAFTLGLLQASFGVRLAYKQEQLNQFTYYMMNNPDVFTEQVLSSGDFQDGLIVVLEGYFKLRTDEKRRLTENVFLDFATSLEKPDYPLERHMDTLQKISQSGIRMLGLIQSEIPKMTKAYVDQKIKQNNNDRSLKTEEEWTRIYTTNMHLSDFINNLIKDYASEAASGKSEKAEEEARRTIESKKRQGFGEIISELEQLGLVRSFEAGSGQWGGGRSAYNLTGYGSKFMRFINPDNND